MSKRNKRTYCVLCQVEINSKPSSVYKHIESRRHVQNEELQRNLEKENGSYEKCVPRSQAKGLSKALSSSHLEEIVCNPDIPFQSNGPNPDSCVLPCYSTEPEDLNYLFGLYVGAGLKKCTEVQASIARLKIQAILHQAALNQLSL